MEDGNYLISLVSPSGHSLQTRIAIADENILGEGKGFLFIGDILEQSILLNIWGGEALQASPFMEGELGRMFSGYLDQTPLGYTMKMDPDCYPRLAISFLRVFSEVSA